MVTYTSKRSSNTSNSKKCEQETNGLFHRDSPLDAGCFPVAGIFQALRVAYELTVARALPKFRQPFGNPSMV
jgi:hypothetical protein